MYEGYIFNDPTSSFKTSKHEENILYVYFKYVDSYLTQKSHRFYF